MPPLSVLVALADPTRCRIIEILRDGAQPVHVLAGSFKISRPAISRHLRVLKQARLISEKKIGRENRYALHIARLKPVQDWLDGLTPAPSATPLQPVAVVSVEAVAVAPPVKAPKAAPKPPAPPAVSRPLAEKPVSQMGFDF